MKISCLKLASSYISCCNSQKTLRTQRRLEPATGKRCSGLSLSAGWSYPLLYLKGSTKQDALEKTPVLKKKKNLLFLSSKFSSIPLRISSKLGLPRKNIISLQFRQLCLNSLRDNSPVSTVAMKTSVSGFGSDRMLHLAFPL